MAAGLSAARVRRNVARIAAIGAASVVLLALAACSGKPENKPTAATGGDPAGATSGSQAQSGGPQSSPAEPIQAAKAAPVAAGPLNTAGWVVQPPFYAAGQEPDWRLQIDDGWFVFKRSGLPEIEAPMVEPKKVGGADVFETSPLTLTIKRGACETSEGEKGEISAIVRFDDTNYDGCAYGGQLQQASAASAEASTVVAGIKVIDACLAKLGETAIVTSVYPREEGRTAAALRTKNGTLYECGSDSSGAIAFMDEVEPGSEGAWMKRMRFLRAGQSDATKCDGAEEVKAGDKVLGRLLTSKCKF